nr:olfactory receptor 65 [Tropidothorax elegans]
METDEKATTKPTTHDFLAFREWVYILGGFSQWKNPLYRLYIALLFLYTLYMQGVAAYAAYLAYPHKEYMLRALHTFLISFFETFVICQRLTIDTTITNMRNLVNSGIFRYEDEDTNEEEQRLLESIVPEITFKSNAWFVMLVCGAFYTLIIFPLTQFFLVSEEELNNIVYVVNPYVPNCFWSPYNRTFFGFILMYLTNVMIIFSTYNVATCQNQIYLSTNVQLRVHLQVLNHSIKNIKERATSRYLRLNNESPSRLDSTALFENEKFQECMCQSLRANIRHHHAILRLKRECQPFIGAMLFIIVTLVALFYANLFCLVLQDPPINFLIIYIMTFLVENCYTFYQCVFGQDILDQSAEIFHSLYGTPWTYSNKKYNRMLNIIMCTTMKPIKLKAYLFDFTASLETYAERFSLMYSIVNVLR